MSNKKEGSASGNTGNAPVKGVVNGRIKQGVSVWCHTDVGNGKVLWTLEELCQHCVDLKIPSLDVVSTEMFPTLKKYNLVAGCTASHMFVRGMNNKMHHPECIGALEKAIEDAAAFGAPNTITFTGFYDTTPEGLKKNGVDVPDTEKGSIVGHDEGIRNCVEGYKKVARWAEEKKVNVVLECLNTRDPAMMKGHPGYQGNHLDICMDIINQVGSERIALLFDAYHVQVMDGDVCRRIGECKDYIKFVQVAGNPGRNAPLANQELNCGRVMQALLDIGYDGYVAHEWIPVGDPLAELIESVAVLDI